LPFEVKQNPSYKNRLFLANRFTSSDLSVTGLRSYLKYCSRISFIMSSGIAVILLPEKSRLIKLVRASKHFGRAIRGFNQLPDADLSVAINADKLETQDG